MNVQDVEQGYRKCFKCLEIKELNADNFHKSKSRYLGFEYKCKSCESKRKKSGKYKDKFAKILSKYRSSDKTKSREFDLDLEFVREKTQENCSYCGFPFSGGLDRIDNSKGHTKDNCVPCCQICNYVRNDEFSTSEMKILGQSIRQIKISRKKLAN